MLRWGVTPCTRCGRGLVTPDYDDELRCLNCGHRPITPREAAAALGLEENQVRARLIFDCYELPAYKPRNGDWQLSPIEAGQLRQGGEARDERA